MRALPCVLALCSLLSMPLPALAERVKDLASVAGVRSNPLVGYGLVVGLDGTGDQTSQAPFTVQSLKAMLNHRGSIRSSRTSPLSPSTPICHRLPSPASRSTSPWPASAMPARCVAAAC
jgi:flagellar basal body P-ring protein FlgI